MLVFLLAQATPAPDPSIFPQSPAGWAGYSAAAMLAAVLSWLALKHLPAKDQQIKDLLADSNARAKAKDEESNTRIEAKDALVMTLIDMHLKAEKEQRDVHAALEREQRVEFQKTLDLMVEHSRKQVEGMGAALKTDIEGLQTAVEALTRTIDSLAQRQ